MQETETNNQPDSSTLSENENKEQPAKKRGRPKAADKPAENVEKSVSKRGRPKKETAK